MKFLMFVVAVLWWMTIRRAGRAEAQLRRYAVRAPDAAPTARHWVVTMRNGQQTDLGPHPSDSAALRHAIDQGVDITKIASLKEE